ncbi:hypothetical protein Leryth_015341 [Lithospermum erythrorhizon]|nr:hypothetical protein Leryth_015341 [Lithospermum erythrorhizon]
MASRDETLSEISVDTISLSDRFFLLHYQEYRNIDSVCPECRVIVNNIDLHCYPLIVGQLICFINRILSVSTKIVGNQDVSSKYVISAPGCQVEKLDISDIRASASSNEACILLKNFPFATVCNFGPIYTLEKSLIHPIPDWRKQAGLVEWLPRSTPLSTFMARDLSSPYSRRIRLASAADYMPHVCNDSSSVKVELSISCMKVYFHDSSCILGTLSLPAANSLFSISDDLSDIFVSTVGTTFSSSLWASPVHDFLWGPVSPDLPPVLNLRVKKDAVGLEESALNLCFGIQHVSCTLSPDCLSTIIGYFALPDWSFGGTDQPVSGDLVDINPGNKMGIVYNVEILGSNLFTPTHSDVSQCLKLDIPQFYISFIGNGTKDVAMKEIPSDLLVMADKIADRSNCLNLFGRDLSLLFLLQKDGGFKSSEVGGGQHFDLISQLSADAWVRIPCVASSCPICIMTVVLNCQLIAEDERSVAGFNGLFDVINQFSIIDEEFKFYTGDVFQFRHLKKSLVDNPTYSQRTTPTVTEIRSCVRSMSVRLHQPVKDSITSEVSAHADMQFFLSADLVNDEPQLLDISFSSLALFSSLNSVKLAEASSSCPDSPVLDINFVKLARGGNKFDIFLSSLQIWLHIYDWGRIIDAVKYYSEELSKQSATDQLTNGLEFYPNDLARVSTIDVSLDSRESPSVSCSGTPEIIEKDNDLYLLGMEEAGITLHVPILLNDHAFSVFREYSVASENDLGNGNPGNQCGFVSFCMQTRCSELIIDHQTLKLKVNLEKASASVEFYSDNNRQMRHLLQLSQIILQANVVNYQMADMSIKLEIQCETLDGWITSHVICLWSSLQFELPEEGTSHLAFAMLELVIKLGKVTILLTDGKWSPGGPLLEIVFRNTILSSNVTEEGMKGLVESDLQVNFNNVDKVMWEPFLEPWNFQLKLDQKHGKTALLNNARTMDILVQSESQLNLNVTESLIEVISRTISMVEDSWGRTETDCPSKDSGFASYQMDKDQYPGSSAPYVIQNLTSLPLLFSVYKGQLHSEFLDLSLLPSQDINALEPGSSFPIYVNETPEEQLIRHLPSQSSDRLSDKLLLEAAHHYILIQLEGTSAPSDPISIDLVGHSYFEVNFSKSSSKSEVHNKDSARRDRKVESTGEGSLNTHEGFVVPVVVDVSVEQYTKLIRLYSTVVLLNSTPMPLEVRFDIPFGVSPKILDPVYPGQEFPLPLHLAEAGRVRCRPLGNTYLWSEAYSISGILSHENRISFLRPIVCYPSHPSSDPFRCCILVNAKCLPSAGKLKKGFPVVNSHENMGFTRSPDHIRHDSDTSKPRYIYWMTLSSPLVLKNYLPEAVSITIENGSVTRHASLSEVEISFSHVDSSHDLTITFHVHGFRSSIVKFPRGDIFSSTAKLDGTKYSLLETIMFDSESYSGRLYVNIEKIMDSLSGAREVCISVPFLLYNCTGFPLVVSDSLNETKGHGFTIPSCYNLDEQGMYIGRRNGLAVLSSNQDLHSIVVKEKPTMASQINHILERSTEGTSVRKPSSAFSSLLQANSITHRSDSNEILIPNSQEEYQTRSQMGLRCNSFAESKERTADAFMYSPEADCSPNEVMVKISRGISGHVAGDVVNGPWSEPFPLVPPTGTITVLIPQPSSSQGHLVSVSASAAPFLGKTRIISFQHRYVISNACNKAFSYKQKGTGLVLHLEAGQHSTIEWTDTTRDLLVSVRFDEPGWQWSGCFLPDHLGDTQIKMRNFISGAVILIRIEVQSADMSFKEEKIVGRPTGDSGTHLILVSIDDTGFMPYRIDNFSKERIRVCQQRCESFETLVNAYTSCPYAWDEPCNPHRLIVEVPGERVVGSYALDDVKDFSPVHFPATLEKPERTLFISVHSEGAIKVLSIIDSTYHIKNDVNSNKLSFPKDKRNLDQKLEPYDHYKERITINVSFIGISLMNSFAEELLFACAEGVAIELMQSLEQQKFSLQISYLQIDNQLLNTPYPVILSFNSENKGQLANQIKMIDDPLRISASASGKVREPVFYLAIAKWRNKDTAPVSFEYISLRVADFHLDLEQDILISLIYFAKTISSRLQFRVLDNTESILHPVYPNFTSVSGASTMTPTNTVSSLRNKQYLNRKTSHDTNESTLFALVVPIGAPWQQIHMLARQQKKIYIEQLDLEPINFSLSFSSSPWVLRNGVLTSGESLIHRGIMALADIEGAQIHLKHLSLSHQLASWESVQEILVRHYTRQFIHEMYKLFGSAGVLGNPIGFARSVGLGIKDFLSVPVRGLFKSPAGLVTGVAQGTTSLVSNTVYAVSDAATQFSKVAHKGIVAFTFDDQMVAKMDKQQKGTASQSKGLINGFFEGLTGLLQSPVRGAEKHGIPGVFSGVVLGVTGLVTRPAASILEVTGKTAQSIRNRSRSHLASQRFRVRLPRALSSESALRAYSWEEAIGTSILAEADEGMKLRDETLIMCKTLKQGGRFVVITYRLILVVSCSSLVDLGKPTFQGIPAEPEWVIETDIQLDSVIHADCNGEVVHIVASSSDTFLRQNNNNMQRRIGGGSRGNRRNSSQTLSPLFHIDVEFVYKDEADNFLAVLLATIEKAKEGGCGSAHFLHQSQLRQAS